MLHIFKLMEFIILALWLNYVKLYVVLILDKENIMVSTKKKKKINIISLVGEFY